MNDKALSNAELELTQKIQMHFPRGVISPEMIQKWNGCVARLFEDRLTEVFSENPSTVALRLVGEEENRRAYIVLDQTGPCFADWLTAREKAEKFYTGQEIKLREMFVIPDGILIRNDIMPIFRSVGASTRDAMEWKVTLGMNRSYEETDVMKYTNAEGPKVPELGFIRRSIRPDEGTFNKSPRDLAKIKMEKNQRWLNLFGYADADNLHFLITGEHLDPETWTWFVNDRLPDGYVAYGCWHPVNAQSKFYWNYPDYCNPYMGARLAEFFPLKTS